MPEKELSGRCCCSGSTCDCPPSDAASEPQITGAAWICGLLNTPSGAVPQVATRLTREDILGAWKARWGVGRMNYKVPPGLYAVGTPGADSPVFVSANYKLSFDHLRRSLKRLDAWILVIDTKGINVWCAAGKGTFGTSGIVAGINQAKLGEFVFHRTIILPQLGAPGVAAHEVTKLTGFKVVYGPVRAGDIPSFVNMGYRATVSMRQVKFGLWDRLVLTPMELVGLAKLVLIGFLILLIINTIGTGLPSILKAVYRTAVDFLPYLGALLVGTVLTPVLLPIIPVREFAWKGWILGILWTGFYLWRFAPIISWKQVVAYIFILPPISAYFAMNFTGSSTYTSLSGVVKEMGMAIPAMLTSVGLGVAFLAVKWGFGL